MFNIDETKSLLNVHKSSTYYYPLLSYIPNANIEKRISCWHDRLPRSEKRGCAINSLVFMGEMDINTGIKEIQKLQLQSIQQYDGVPFQHIVDWMNARKSKDKDDIYFQEYIINICFNDKININYLLYTFTNELTNNSCSIVRFNRDIEKAKQKGLSSGHTLIIAKDKNNILTQIDPQKMTINTFIKNRNHIEKFYKEQHFVSVSILKGYHLPKKHN